MTEQEQQIIENALNGASYTDIAAAYGVSDNDVMSLIAYMLHMVKEYQASGEIVYFDCNCIEQAQANKLKVLDVLARLRLWDDIQRPVVELVLTGVPIQTIQERYPVEKAQASEWLSATLMRVAAHLKDGDLAGFTENRVQWVKANMSRVMDIINRFTSWEHGRQLKNITFSTITPDSAL